MKATATLHLRSIRRKYSAQQRSSPSFQPSSSTQTLLLLTPSAPCLPHSATPTHTHTHTHSHSHDPHGTSKGCWSYSTIQMTKWAVASQLRQEEEAEQEEGRGGAVHRRPEIAYATSSAVAASAASSFSYGRRSQRRPSLLVARWSLAKVQSVQSSPMPKQENTT